MLKNRKLKIRSIKTKKPLDKDKTVIDINL